MVEGEFDFINTGSERQAILEINGQLFVLGTYGEEAGGTPRFSLAAGNETKSWKFVHQ